MKSSAAKEDLEDHQKDFGNLTHAKEHGIKPYNKMTKELKGTGLQAHHIVDQRFKLGIQDIVAVTPSEHQIFTNV